MCECVCAYICIYIYIDTVKAFLEKNKLGKYNEEEMKRKAEEKKQEEEAERIAAQLCKIGSRCEVCVPNQPKRRAIIMYVGMYSNSYAFNLIIYIIFFFYNFFIGKTEFKEGWWIGVKYDEPLGKNNGT